MGGYEFGPKTPPLPGQPAPHYGQRYGSPRPPEGLVSSQTPVANKLVEGITSFVSGFRETQDAEKQRAREQALDNIRMANELGLPIDMKKTARLLRKGGIDLNYDAMPQQAAPMPGPTPQQQQAGQQFSAAGMIGGPQAIAGAMGGSPMPGQGAPLPGRPAAPQKGGGNFFQRFGRAISEPFRGQGVPLPEQQGTIVEALQRLQLSGASRQEVEAAQQQVALTVANAMKTFVGGEMGSPEWMQATQLLYSVDKVKELPMEYKVRSLQKIAKVDEQEAARLIYAAENINLPGGPNPEADRNAMAFVNAFQRSHAGADPSKALVGYRKMIQAKSDDELLSIDWGLSDNKDDQEALKATRVEFDKLGPEYPKAPRAALWTAATYARAGDQDAADSVLEPFGPPRSAQEADRQRAREAREQTRFAQGRAEDEMGSQVEDYANRLFQEAKGDIGTAIRKLGDYQTDINAPWQYRSFATRIRERLEDIGSGGRSGVDVRVSAAPSGPSGGGNLTDEQVRQLQEGNR